MQNEVTTKIKGLLINSYIQPTSNEDKFFLIFNYIKDRKGVEIESSVHIKDELDIDSFLFAYVHAKSWFERKFNLVKVFDAANQLISLFFDKGETIGTPNAEGVIS